MNLLLNTPPLTVYEHMALDETLVQSRPEAVTLRFYQWGVLPAVTFGYSQFFTEVKRTLASQSFKGDFTRRPTGGGIVFHQDDLTFSLIFPYAGRPAEIYQKLHFFIFQEIKRFGHPHLSLEGVVSKEAYKPSVSCEASACFVRPVENDILDEHNRKILGGAIRRFGTTVLYQGSLQIKEARTNPAYKQAVTQAVRSFLGVDLYPRRTEETFLTAARKLAQNQYTQPSWKEKF